MLDSSSGLASSFQFISYKVDAFHFSMEKNIVVLEVAQRLDDSAWKMDISIRNPVFLEERNQYLAGVRCVLVLRPDKNQPDFQPVKLEATISGLFQSENKFAPELESHLVKSQMPAILMPYLRSAITSFLANAGFGSVILPLVNINNLAENALKDVQIQVISKNETPTLPPLSV